MAEQRGPKPDVDNQARLAQMWTELFSSIRTAPSTRLADTASINITFDGAGATLVEGMSGVVQIPFPCRIIDAWMFSGIFGVGGTQPAITTSCSIMLSLSQIGQWSSGTGSIGSAPSLSGAAEQQQDISDWIVNLQPGDLIAYSLADFIGSATFVTLTLTVRKLDVVNIGLGSVTDSGIAITSDGRQVTLR
jgi:hypothetical protein